MKLGSPEAMRQEPSNHAWEEREAKREAAERLREEAEEEKQWWAASVCCGAPLIEEQNMCSRCNEYSLSRSAEADMQQRYQAIADAHNAELAAEREKTERAEARYGKLDTITEREIRQLREQLAAERGAVEALRKDNDRLKQQYEMTALDCKNTRDREELLTALAKSQARIKTHNRNCPVNFDTDATALETFCASLYQEVEQLRKQLDAERRQLEAAEQSASDNADWFDALCIELRELLGMPKCEAPFDVSPILDEVKKLL